MINVKINGQDNTFNQVSTVADLVELVKTNIDPDHIITSITVNGRMLDEHEWSLSPDQLGDAVTLEVETGRAEDFVAERLIYAPEVVKACIKQFVEAREAFQEGKSISGNKLLISAVNTLQAFFEWYGSVTDLIDEEERPIYSLTEEIEALVECCETVCQHQLYQSWWALSETLKNEVEPKLNEVLQKCNSFLQGNSELE